MEESAGYEGGCDGWSGDAGGPRLRRSSAMTSMLFRLFSSTGFVRTLEWVSSRCFEVLSSHSLIDTSLKILLLVREERVARHTNDEVSPTHLAQL